MIKQYTISFLKQIRFLSLLPLVMVIGLITMPLTLLFRWNGFWILCIAHQEWCSLKEAKRLFEENKDGKYTITYGNEYVSDDNIMQSDLSYINNNGADSSSSSIPCNSEQIYTDIKYCGIQGNIYHQ